MFSWPVPKMFIKSGIRSPSRSMGFFRRNSQNSIEYFCSQDGGCLLIRLNKNRCQHCRFKKCPTVGMSPDLADNDLALKKSRKLMPGKVSRGTTATTVSNDATSSVLSSNVSVNFCSTISEVASETVQSVDVIHPDDHVLIEDIRKWLEQPISVPSPVLCSPIVSASMDPTEAQRIQLWQHFAIKLTSSIEKTVEFSKWVPGFPNLNIDDQLILTKMGFFEIWLCNAARQSSNTTLTFDDGEYVTLDQLEIMYDMSFSGSVMGFASNLNALGLNDIELAFFSAAVLSTERSGAADLKAIRRTHLMTIEYLKQNYYKRVKNSTVCCKQLLGDGELGATITALLGELRLLGAWHALLIDWLRLNWMKINLPPLFSETFDIPNYSKLHRQSKW